MRGVAGTALTHPVVDAPIESKLHAPSARKEWVERQGLLHELTRAAPAKLVLVDASAGFGKTTLVAQWRSSAIECRRFAWLSVPVPSMMSVPSRLRSPRTVADCRA
ncbi:MAG TPA: hypothetical protein VMV92_42350 [Streptosporangiaceae bacterium]|nr:hypothetical protein [Streptosporangiaceae bacterium]